MIVLFNYCCGKGLFWPSMVFVASHVIIYSLFTSLIQVIVFKYEVSFLRVFYNVFNGLANLYCHNWINFNEKKKNGYNAEFYHNFVLISELGTQLIFLFENVFIFTFSMYTFSNNDQGYAKILIGMVGTAFGIHFLGSMLKLCYYWNYHIWRNLLWDDLKKQCQLISNFFRNSEDVKNQSIVDNSPEGMDMTRLTTPEEVI